MLTFHIMLNLIGFEFWLLFHFVVY